MRTLRLVFARGSLFLCAAVAALAVVLSATIARADGVTGGFDAATFKIMNDDGSQTIGHGEFHIENAAAQPVLVGQNRYLDGEYDVERDIIRVAADAATPSLVSFEHSYFHADGSPRFVARADLRNGQAECTTYESGDASPEVKQIDFPADTYAGATAVLALENALRTQAGHAAFHVFDCGPTPNVVAVQAQPTDEQQGWSFYPGRVMPLDVTADLGWLGSVVSGLVPHRLAWFDPASGWRFVGGKIQRYFATGPQVMLVRENAAISPRASN